MPLRKGAVDSELAILVEHPSFRSLMDNLPCVAYIARPSWPPIIEYISGNVERLIGYTPADFYADPNVAFDLIHPEDRERFLETVRDAMNRAEPYHVEYRAVHRNGRDVYHAAALSLPVLDAAGQVVRRHGIIVDITDQKRLEQELLQSQRLAAIGEMAAMMAHEIRNPLAGISLALRALRDMVPSDPEAAECLEDMESCLVRINDTVSRALDFAKVRPLDVRPCQLAEVVAGAARLTAAYVARHGVRLKVRVPADLPPLAADPAQLEQVFVNLILNACKAMPEGGRLTVRAWAEPPRMLAEVSDTGVGIPPEQLSRVFEPFYSGFRDGSGLGLPLCHRILAAHNGAIQAESTPGKGTTFHIELPLEPGHAARAAR
ncbi:MAG TPA: ATP-binding protein [Planctomycetota bacterium]|nr:ATP-binding protein [Planctomycetota bacterium]